jgi:hypothetical protein
MTPSLPSWPGRAMGGCWRSRLTQSTWQMAELLERRLSAVCAHSAADVPVSYLSRCRFEQDAAWVRPQDLGAQTAKTPAPSPYVATIADFSQIISSAESRTPSRAA